MMTTNVKSRLNPNVISIVYFKNPTARINYCLINKKMTPSYILYLISVTQKWSHVK